jgi:hypothetical protein
MQIRELKRRHRRDLALDRALPTTDLGVPLPLSTGNPLFDAALLEKLTATATLDEAEHLNRVWGLVRGASREELDALATHAAGLLNDAKLLLALRVFHDGDEESARRFLDALPWGHRLAFPIAAVQPAAALFTGWRSRLSFRLVEPRFPALRALFRAQLAEASGAALLRYRSTIQAAAALLRFRFEGERERAIHDLCFGDGRAAVGVAELEPIGTYAEAREALRRGGVPAFVETIGRARAAVPLTSLMGLLGGAGVRLGDDRTEAEALRDQIVRSATAVESLLRLQEWSPWLTEGHVETLAAKVQRGLDRGLDIPFHKIVNAFGSAPERARKLLARPLLLPLLRRYGERIDGLLGGRPMTFAQPACAVHVMSFLLHAVAGAVTARPPRLLLFVKDGAVEGPALDLGDVVDHLADGSEAARAWVLERFGGQAAWRGFSYDFAAIGKAVSALDPAAPLLLDLPYSSNLAMLEMLLPFEQVYNLGSVYGAPGEIGVAYDAYRTLSVETEEWSIHVWQRNSDSAARRFAEVLDRLRNLQALAAHVGEGDAS